MPLDPPDMYCAEQIYVPPTFPGILKQYTKAAIRTQPYDLLRWSAAYFRALANGEKPPVKERLEYPPVTAESGLTTGFLEVLIKQFGKETTVPVSRLTQIWDGICLDGSKLEEILQLCGNREQSEVDWLTFVGVAAGHLTENLLQTMNLLCELLTEEPEGGSASIPFRIFRRLYLLLAEMDCPNINGIGPRVPDNVTSAGLEYLEEISRLNSTYIMPRNTTHILCPPLY